MKLMEKELRFTARVFFNSPEEAGEFYTKYHNRKPIEFPGVPGKYLVTSITSIYANSINVEALYIHEEKEQKK